MNDDVVNENNDDEYRIDNEKAASIGKMIESTLDDNNTLDTEVVVPLKYLSNFQRFLDLPLINYKI